jgi:hypothetical protein
MGADQSTQQEGYHTSVSPRNLSSHGARPRTRSHCRAYFLSLSHSAPSGDDFPGNVRRGSTSQQGSSASQSRVSGSGVPDATSPNDGPASASDRASALEAKLGKRRPKPKDIAAIKAAHWKRYTSVNQPGADPTPHGLNAPPTQPKLVDGVLRRGPPSASPQPTIASLPPSSSSSPGMIPGINRSQAAPTAEQLMSGQKRYETPEEAQIRAQRAALYGGAAKEKSKQRKEASKEERWKAWSQFDSSTSSATTSATPPPPADLYSTTPSPGAPSGSPSASSLSLAASPPAADDNSFFEEQLEYLMDKVQRMPPASVSLIRKILQNLLQAGPTPTLEQQKFRKIKLANPKIQEAVVKVDGGMELLTNVGFVQREMTANADLIGVKDLYLYFPDGTPLDLAELAYDLLDQGQATPSSSAQPPASSASPGLEEQRSR